MGWGVGSGNEDGFGDVDEAAFADSDGIGRLVAEIRDRITEMIVVHFAIPDFDLELVVVGDECVVHAHVIDFITWAIEHADHGGGG